MSKGKTDCNRCQLNDNCPGFDGCPHFVRTCFFCKECGKTFILDKDYDYRAVGPAEATALRLAGCAFTEVTSAGEKCTGKHPEGNALRWHCPK
jgi:hypothetical protein